MNLPLNYRTFGVVAVSALSLTLSLSMSSCVVGRKKYDAMSRLASQTEAARKQCDSTLAALTKRQEASVAEASRLRSDTTVRGNVIRGQQKQLGNMNQSYNDLLNNSSKEAANMSGKINKLSTDLKSREQRVAELEGILASKDEAVRRLRASVADALLNFKEKDLTVNVKNGKVYVSLSEQLLFKSGSYTVDPRGVDAIKKLAGVLVQNPDISVTVEGHTDDVKLKEGTAGMKDNWDLSVLRATGICRELTDAGVPGARLIASGRSEFLPLAPGKAAEVRQKNRRTEIILTPKLDELFQILQQ
ncbi:MAG: OmpA family protein [Bacteroidota bacterium]